MHPQGDWLDPRQMAALATPIQESQQQSSYSGFFSPSGTPIHHSRHPEHRPSGLLADTGRAHAVEGELARLRDERS